MHSVEAFSVEASNSFSVEVLDNNVIGAGNGWELNTRLSGFTDRAALL